MATSTIKYDNYRDGTVTAVSGSDVTNLSVRQYGRVVVINGFIRNASLTANTGSHIATISGVSLPNVVLRSLCGVAQAAYNHPADVAYLSIYAEGNGAKITVSSNTTGSRVVYFSTSYIA